MSILGSVLKNLFAKETSVEAPVTGMPGDADPRIVNLMNLQFGQQKLKHCRYGWMLYSGKFIGRCFDLYGEYSESEVEIFRRCLRAGDVVVDVGANIGDLTLPISQLVGEQGRVVAFESHPEIFNILCANLALNGIKNVKPLQAFVAHSSDVQTGSQKWGQYAFIGVTWKPAFCTIDVLNLPACRLIKIDVDGNELEVLMSAEQTLKRCQPILYFENDLHEKSEALLSYVAGLGYRMWFHSAPIFQEKNYFANPENAWAPDNICSFMVLALPPGVDIDTSELTPVVSSSDWWE